MVQVSVLSDLHPTDDLILPGITGKHIIEICKKNGIPVKEIPFTLEEMTDADEAIVSGTTVFIKRRISYRYR